MNKQDWIEYFEAVNGRSPEQEDIQAALVAGEFQELEELTQGTTSSATTQTQQKPTQVPTTQQGTYTQTPTYPNQTLQQSSQLQHQQPFAAQPNQQGFSANYYTNGQGQQMQNGQVSSFANQYWAWLVSAWKSPTSVVPTHPHNGWVSLALLVLFTSLIVYIPITQIGFGSGVDFGVFFNVVLSFAFINFSFILAGFSVRRVIYKDITFTLSKALEYYGRLFAPNVLLLGLASLFILLKVYTLGTLLTVVANCLFFAACAFTLYFDTDHSPLDRFYKYVLATILFVVIVTIAFMIGASIAGEMLLKNFSLPSFPSSFSSGLFR